MPDFKSAVLGFPRIGRERELKKAVEAYWKGSLTAEGLGSAARGLRREHWFLQKEAGIDVIPSNDFSYYDQVLDMTTLLGAVPERFGRVEGLVSLETYFTMARGGSAMEMTKWFDTNYHYLVPEFKKNQRFGLSSDKVFREYDEALVLGIKTRPVLIGPVTYLLLGKSKEKGFQPLDLLEEILPVYVEVLKRLKSGGVDAVQIDEPMLVTDLDARTKKAYREAYRLFANEIPSLALFLTPYFGALADNLSLALSLPVEGIHLDLVRAPKELGKVVRQAPRSMTLSLGIVDGRNIWKNDLNASIQFLKSKISSKHNRRYLIASSCSFLHAPVDLGE